MRIATIASAKPTCASAGRRDEVADRVHAGHRGAQVVVDLDEAALVDADARALEPDALRARPATDAHDDRVDLEVAGLVAAVRVQREPVRTGVDAGDRDAGLHGDVPLLERAGHDLGDLLVDARAGCSASPRAP